jgi:hypothetical protein
MREKIEEFDGAVKEICISLKTLRFTFDDSLTIGSQVRAHSSAAANA